MSYQQIREILKDVESYHRVLHAVVNELYDEDDTDDHPEDGRREWLVRYIEGQSKAIADALSRYRMDSRQTVLDVWIQYVPDERIKRRLNEMQSLTDADRERLTELMQGFDQELRDFYSSLADQSSSEAVQELFTSLSEQSQSILEQTAWGMRREDGTPPEEDTDSN